MLDFAPISDADLADLFTLLNRPNPAPCTHTYAETEAFLRSRKLPVEETLIWLGRNGGGCDCEVIFNVADSWGERIGWAPDDEDA